MNTENLYLIEKPTLLRHINNEARLYAMLCDLIGQLTLLHDEQELVELALHYRKASEDIRESWNIPRSYIVTQDADALYTLYERELRDPEDAGYLFCNGLCDLCPCGDSAEASDACSDTPSDIGTERAKSELPDPKALTDLYFSMLRDVLEEERQAESPDSRE